MTRAPTRALGVDLGARRIGIALSDPSGVLATPLTTLERTGDPAADHRAILAVARDTGATVVVVGLPRSLSGKLGPAARSVLDEVEALRELARPDAVDVDTYDERFTTMIAKDGLREAHPRRARRRRAQREQVDAAAATVILQSWLEAQS